MCGRCVENSSFVALIKMWALLNKNEGSGLVFLWRSCVYKLFPFIFQNTIQNTIITEDNICCSDSSHWEGWHLLTLGTVWHGDLSSGCGEEWELPCWSSTPLPSTCEDGVSYSLKHLLLLVVLAGYTVTFSWHLTTNHLLHWQI